MALAPRRPIALTALVVASSVVLGTPARSEPDDQPTRIRRFAKILESDRSFKLRALAARRLGAFASQGALRDPKILKALVLGLADPNAVVRGVCAQALGAHRDPSTLADLERSAQDDESRLVRRSARLAADRIRPLARPTNLVVTRHSRPLSVALGRLEIEEPSGLPPDKSASLLASAKETIEASLAPHQPPPDLAAKPDIRLDVTITRSDTNEAGEDIRFEARVILVELPHRNLRHASQAIARTKSTVQNAKRRTQLEERVALKAVSRAVEEALTSLLGSS